MAMASVVDKCVGTAEPSVDGLGKIEAAIGLPDQVAAAPPRVPPAFQRDIPRS
jgi:hypothetical protein